MSYLSPEEARRRRVIPGRVGHCLHPLRRSPADAAPLPGQRQDDAHVAGRNGLRGDHQEAQWPLVCQHCLLETARGATPKRNPIGGRRGRGHQPSGGGQRRRALREPQGAGKRTTQDPPVAAGPGTPYAGQPRLVGSPTAHRRHPAPHCRPQEQRPSSRQPGIGRKVPHPGYREPQRRRHDHGGITIEGPLRCRDVQPAEPDPLQGGLVRHRDRGSRPVVPQQQDLLSLRRGEPRAGPGNHVVLPQLRRHSSASGGQRERSSQPA